MGSLSFRPEVNFEQTEFMWWSSSHVKPRPWCFKWNFKKHISSSRGYYDVSQRVRNLQQRMIHDLNVEEEGIRQLVVEVRLDLEKSDIEFALIYI